MNLLKVLTGAAVAIALIITLVIRSGKKAISSDTRSSENSTSAASSTVPHSSTPYVVTDVFRNLRQKVLSLRPDQIGLNRDPAHPVWGALMETGYDKAAVTLVTLGDGTVSLYSSNGGGMIGVGGQAGPRKAGEEYLRFAVGFVSRCSPTTTFPLPEVGRTRFYLLTFDGTVTVEASEADLGNNRLPLSSLFFKAQEVITQARLAEQQRGGK